MSLSGTTEKTKQIKEKYSEHVKEDMKLSHTVTTLDNSLNDTR